MTFLTQNPRVTDVIAACAWTTYLHRFDTRDFLLTTKISTVAFARRNTRKIDAKQMKSTYSCRANVQVWFPHFNSISPVRLRLLQTIRNVAYCTVHVNYSRVSRCKKTRHKSFTCDVMQSTKSSGQTSWNFHEKKQAQQKLQKPSRRLTELQSWISCQKRSYF